MQPITSKSSSGAADWQLDAAMAADITLDALFRRAFRVFADRTAVTWEAGQRRYREVGERAWRLANAVRAKGYDRGDTIAILSETRPEYVECYAAMAALGITVATLNIRLRPDEIAVCLRKARPSAVLTSGTLAGLLEGLRSEVPDIGDWIEFEPVQVFDNYEAILAEQRGRAASDRRGRGHPQHPFHQWHDRSAQRRTREPASGGHPRLASFSMVRTDREGRFRRLAATLPLPRRRGTLRDLPHRRHLCDIQARRYTGHVRAHRARAAELDSAPARRDHRLHEQPTAAGQRSVEPALRHRLRQHDAERRREADGDLRHRFLRRLRAERVELSARARLFRPRRSAVAAQTTLAVDGGPRRRRGHERDACRPAGRMRGAGPEHHVWISR